jgi:heme oxygenase
MAGAVGVTPAHLVLREATRDAHEAAEATAGMRRLLAGELGEAGYAGLLRAQLSLFREWEAARSDWLAALTEWRYTSRAALIETDLHRTHFSGDALPHETATPIADESAPTVWAAPTVSSAPAGGNAHWGELYVIEGSALGGRVITRRLRELYPQLPHTFYAVGEIAPSNWRRFQSLLDHALPDEASQQAAVEAAQRMFAQFQQTLTDPAAHD